MFLGFAYLLVTAWRHESAIIPASSISHLNSTLRYSAVLIQAYGVQSPTGTVLVPFPINCDIPTKQNGTIICSIFSKRRIFWCIRYKFDVKTTGTINLILKPTGTWVCGLF